MRNDETDALDRALDWAVDQALAHYSSAEPRDGLAQRVIDRVRAQGAAPRFGFRGWALALAAAAACVMAAVFWWARPVPHARVAGPARRPVPVAVQKTAVVAGFKQQARRANTPARLPKLREFPAPAPLSEEERAWLTLVERAPARDALLDLQRRGDEPIEVEAIKIEPLRSDDAK
ncbi:MAG TPA: hypothetical protein VMR62_31335 [Bryobacteraceae bacterium]|jgi:hypothetical protein|nr:hypothetical protein [Bryobacteraceae bacterium]